MDDRLVTTARVTEELVRDLGLPYFATLVAEEYFASEAVRITAAEQEVYAAFAKTCYRDLSDALDELSAGPYRREFGLSPKLWALATESWLHRERHVHAFGRFDVAGVVDGTPARLIEFNADTATVLAEAALLQPAVPGGEGPWNDIVDRLAGRLAAAAELCPPDDRLVLIATLGHGEDDDSARIWKMAAEQAGLYAEIGHLPSVTFAPGEGVYRQLGPESWTEFGILVKLFPWDWVDREEPALLDDLAALMADDGLVVVNPPYASLMQSKAMLAELHRRHRGEERYLAAGWGDAPAEEKAWVATKPLFGREGENVEVRRGAGKLHARADGGYGGLPRMWQAYTRLPVDGEGDTYQAGVYWAGQACGLAWRRSSGVIVDADAEYLSGLVGDSGADR